MPTYEYECNHCHHAFELMQKISDAPITMCPQCGKPEVVRLVSAAGFQLKGTGWYVTDFKNKDKPKDTTKASSEAATPSVEKTTTETKTKQGESN